MATEELHPGIRIFEYLEDLAKLNVDVRRDIREHKDPEKLIEVLHYPRPENLYVKQFGEDDERPFLSVQKQKLEKEPRLPDNLKEWVVFNEKFSQPQSKEYIVKKEHFRDSQERRELHTRLKNGELNEIPAQLKGWIQKNEKTGEWERIEEQEVRYRFSDYPELQQSFQNYVNGPWTEWKNRNYPIYIVNQLYETLFGIREFLKQSGEEYELLWGHDVLTWKKDNHSIFHPFFFTPLEIHFNPHESKIELVKSSTGGTFFEAMFLEDLDISNLEDVQKETKKLNAQEYEVWNSEALSTKGTELVNYVSLEGENQFSENDISTPQIAEHPQYWNYPVVFLRKKSAMGWAEYAQKIQSDIEDNTEIPSFIRELSGEEVEDKNIQETNSKESEISNGELYFPLPYNQEQKDIAQRVENRYGVVVQGPPGTGKSHTIANLLSRFLAQGKSVLVTSKTGKALQVIREKLPAEIRDLVMTQIPHAQGGADIKSVVNSISKNLNDTKKFTTSRIEEIEEELSSLREKKQKVYNKVKRGVPENVPTELTVESGQTFSIEGAIQELETAKEQEEDWIPDDISFRENLNFTEKEVFRVFELYKKLTEEERNNIYFWVPALEDLPSLTEVNEVIEEYNTYKDRAFKWQNAFQQMDPIEAYEEELGDKERVSQNSEDFIGTLREMHAFLSDVQGNSTKRRLFDVISKSEQEYKKWKNTIFPSVEQYLANLREYENQLLGIQNKIEYDSSLNVDQVLKGFKEIRDKLEDKDELSRWDKFTLSKNTKEILKTALFNGQNPTDVSTLEVLETYFSQEKERNDLQQLWKEAFQSVGIELEERKEFSRPEFEEEVKEFRKLIDYKENYQDISRILENYTHFTGADIKNIEDVEELLRLLDEYQAYTKYSKNIEILEKWKGQLQGENSHELVYKIISALDRLDGEEYEKLYNEFSSLLQKYQEAEELNNLVQKIEEKAPKLVGFLKVRANEQEHLGVSSSLLRAWDLAQLKNWIEHVFSDDELRKLEKELENLRDREKEQEKQLVIVSAWNRLKNQVTKEQEEALEAYALSMKNLGKGTGKHAPKHRREANEALKTAKDAVPIWIMPLDQVLHMFNTPQAGMFDVVIFDESSQIDVRGLNIAYLGKQQIAVGDPEQISPQSFTREESIDMLIEKHLKRTIPNSGHFSVTSSFFDIVSLKLSDKIMLTEHFRSVREIIGFSNRHFYNENLQVLRSPDFKYPLKPALESIYVSSGYMNANNKVNEPEAQALVNKLSEMVNDQTYWYRDAGGDGEKRDTTFGIVTLLGQDQGKYILELLREKISDEEIERRNIVVGDPYAFQGDERDVILLSMVQAPDINSNRQFVHPLSDQKGNRQRINVAMSRARDKMILFHSVERKELNGDSDWRATVLDWFLNYDEEKRKEGEQVLEEEYKRGVASSFSLEVGKKIIEKGYKVIPEYEVGGYRIDLVVEGEEARLGVECDGDQYHGPNKWEDDLDREAVLKRAGWDIWRVKGSSYYKNPDEALSNLWQKLGEMGIKPVM